jgi:hypothetical protein
MMMVLIKVDKGYATDNIENSDPPPINLELKRFKRLTEKPWFMIF